MILALCSGTLAGLVLFAVQRLTVVPLIEQAERYEHGENHHWEEWKPAPGTERIVWTALTTVVTGIGFAALFFGSIHLAGREVTVREGVWWGIAAYACIHVAPSFGLPPLPPGVPVPDVQQRQLWWTGTVLATATGLWLAAHRAWLRRICGALCIAIPHLIGAPAAAGASEVPSSLIRSFTIASLASTACYWLVLGAAGGLLFSRTGR